MISDSRGGKARVGSKTSRSLSSSSRGTTEKYARVPLRGIIMSLHLEMNSVVVREDDSVEICSMLSLTIQS